MSRCFPYPTPGYVRNPVAVAEAETTAKLQKERKNDEKKEKKSVKKAVQQGGTPRHSKHSHKKRKHKDIGTIEQPKVISKESIEQLEKSGLSEEHGAPYLLQTVHDSPESSQDSSKRRKVVLPSPNQAKNGSIFRIKIKREQDSPKGVMAKPVVLEQPQVKQMTKQNSIQQQNKVDVKLAAAAPQRINVEREGIQKQANTLLPSRFTRRENLQMAKVVQQIDPKLPMMPPVGRIDPPPVEMVQRDLPSKAAPAKVLQRVVPQLSSVEIQRKCPPSVPKVLQEVSAPATSHPENLQPSRNQLQRPIASLSKAEPSSSGRKAEAVEGKGAKQSKSDRKRSRKAEKKEKKFRDLFVTWNPPLFEMEESDVGAQDWLFSSTRSSDASVNSCKASDGSVLIQSMEQQPSLQPKATFWPDLHIYQLPYVVPF